MKCFIYVGLVCLFVCNVLAGTCSLTASVAARNGASWESNGVPQQIWEISITNTGSCSFSTATVVLSLPSGSYISESWNFDSSTFLVSNFGSLDAQTSYGDAGFVLSQGGAPTVSSATAHCDASCSASSSEASESSESASASSSESASASSESASASSESASASSSESEEGTCQLSVTQTRRTSADGNWTDAAGTTAFQIYDLTFTNTGSKTLTFAQFDISFPQGYPVSYWNLAKTCCTQIGSAASFNVSLASVGFGAPQSVLSAGYIFQYNASNTLVDPMFNPLIVATQFYNFVECSD